MTVNITINADTLELTNVDGMTRIVCNGEPANSEKKTRDTLAEHKAKTKVLEDAVCAQIDKMTKDFEERKDKPESESDWIVRRKLKPVKINGRQSLKEGLYFRRDIDGDQWIPYIFKFSNNLIYTDETELLGPITPDMFL